MPITKNLSCGRNGIRADLARSIDLARAYGFQSVDPDIEAISAMNSAARADLLRLLEAQQIGWGLASLPIDLHSDDAEFERCFGRLLVALPSAAAVGVGGFCTYLMPSVTLPVAARFDLDIARLRRIMGALERHNMSLAVEYVGPRTMLDPRENVYIRTLEGMVELLVAVDRPRIGIYLDSFHWWTAGETAEDVLATRDVVPIYGVDINDAVLGRTRDEQIDSDRRCAGSTNVIPIGNFVRAVVACGFDGPVNSEPFDTRLAALDAREAAGVVKASMDSVLDPLLARLG